MKFNVYLLDEAEEDLFEIHQYVAQSGSPMNADKLIVKLEETASDWNDTRNGDMLRVSWKESVFLIIGKCFTRYIASFIRSSNQMSTSTAY
jgi:hypothetical protein